MRKTLTALGMAAMLTLGSGTAVFAQTGDETTTNDDGGDDTGKLGLLGLIGLAGLAGLLRRDNRDDTVRTTTIDRR